MPDISKINALAIGSVSKVDGLAKASILDIDGIAVNPNINPDAATSGFLFTYSGAAAAYSVRQLNNNAPYVLRVRRVTGTGNTGNDDEADVKFDTTLTDPTISLDSPVDNFSAGGSNATTLGEFLNVGTVGGTTYTDADSLSPNTAEAYATTWYDLTGNQNHAEQTTPASQPQIHSGTVNTDLITENGKPAVEFDGTNQYLISSTWDGSSIANLSHSRVYSTPSAAVADNAGTIWGFANSTTPARYILSNPSTILISGEYMSWSWSNLQTAPTFNDRLGSTTYRRAANTQVLEFENWLASGFSFFQNGSSQTIDLNTSGFSTSSVCSPSVTITDRFGLAVLARPAEDVLQAMKAQEFIFWDVDRSGNRTGIETDVNGFFGTY